jgi:hypothetical protein
VSAMSLALLLTTATATGVGVAALHAAHGLRRQVTALRGELAAGSQHIAGCVPQARSASQSDEIRTAVAQALADERERELAEARAFWAAQEARDAADHPSVPGGSAGLGKEPALDPAGEDVAFYMPRQADFAGLDASGLEPFGADELTDRSELLDELADELDRVEHLDDEDDDSDAIAEDSPELAAAMRRHPSHPDFVPTRTPVVTDHERTVARLDDLADRRVPLTDVRPGPLGTLDVYVFEDGTTLCMTPGDRRTAGRLAEAVRAGGTPFLLGGSGVTGAYTLTFACEAPSGAEHVYVLADRVIASL